MSVWILLWLASAPVLAILVFIYVKDKYEKEPFHLLLFSFLLGATSIIPAVIMELAAQKAGITVTTDIRMTMVYSFLVVGLSEELSKFIVLRFYIFPKNDFNEPFDGIVYAVVISMGFAMVENIMYVLQGGLHVALIRMFTAVPAHAAFGVLMGYFAGKAKFSGFKGFYLTLGIIVAIIVHGAYDFFIFQLNYPYLKMATVLVLVAGIIVSFIAIRVSRKSSPFKDRQVSES